VGEGFTLEDVKRNHIADLQVQGKYGVRYVQYWVNDDAGMVFCLMEGPDAESCSAVHKEAHGDVACKIVEVKRGDVDLFMGEGRVNEFDMTEDTGGTLDTGYRFILLVDTIGFRETIQSLEGLIRDTISKYHGREVIHPEDEIMAVFNSCHLSVKCSHLIQSEIGLFKRRYPNQKFNSVEFRIGVVAGQPLTENEGFFSESIQKARSLCHLAGVDQVLVSPLLSEICMGNKFKIKTTSQNLRILSQSEENLLINLNNAIEANLANHDLTVELLVKELGISRPQLYRKIKALTGIPPMEFIKEVRLIKAEKMIRNSEENISQVALDVGFSSPSYFAKVFQKRFGKRPSQYTDSIRFA